MALFRPWWLGLLGLLVLLSGGPAWAATACTLKWQEVTTYTDGTTAVGQVTYKVYYQGKRLAATTKPTIRFENCKAGQYHVTANTPDTIESTPSNKWRARQPSAPKALRED